MTYKPRESAPGRKTDEKHGSADGLRGTDQRQGDLRDVEGGTFDHPAGLDPLPRGLEHRSTRQAAVRRRRPSRRRERGSAHARATFTARNAVATWRADRSLLWPTSRWTKELWMPARVAPACSSSFPVARASAGPS